MRTPVQRGASGEVVAEHHGVVSLHELFELGAGMSQTGQWRA